MGLFARSEGRIRREATDWRVRLAGDSSPETAAAFRAWRGSDPRNAEAYERIDRIWDVSRQLGVAVEEAAPRHAGSRARGPGRHGLAIAASLLVAMPLVFLVAVQQRWLRPPWDEAQLLVLTTPAGAIGEKELPDGSRLTLDASSHVEARMSGSERLLSLVEGRARFAVAADGRPFVVRAGSSEIAATGSLFDVSLYDGRATVVLIEGSLVVRGAATGPDRAERLEAGEKLVAGAPGRRQKVQQGELAWPRGMIGFEGASLGEAAATMNRYGKAKLRLGDRRVEGLRVTGAWRAGDVGGFARSLERAFNLSLERRADGSLLLRTKGVRPER